MFHVIFPKPSTYRSTNLAKYMPMYVVAVTNKFHILPRKVRIPSSHIHMVHKFFSNAIV